MGSQLKVGDIIEVGPETNIPADCLFLYSLYNYQYLVRKNQKLSLKQINWMGRLIGS